jgi:hypothetical protein
MSTGLEPLRSSAFLRRFDALSAPKGPQDRD